MLLICWYVLLEYMYYKPITASGRVSLDLVQIYSDVVKVVFFTLGVSVSFFLMGVAYEFECSTGPELSRHICATLRLV